MELRFTIDSDVEVTDEETSDIESNDDHPGFQFDFDDGMVNLDSRLFFSYVLSAVVPK